MIPNWMIKATGETITAQSYQSCKT